MTDDTTRRLLRLTAKRGGAVSAGALVTMLAGGSLALAGGAGSAADTTPGRAVVPTADAQSAQNVLAVPTAVPTGGLPVPQSGAAPAPLRQVLATTRAATGAATVAVTKTVQSLTGTPTPPHGNPPPHGGPPPSGSGHQGGGTTHHHPGLGAAQQPGSAARTHLHGGLRGSDTPAGLVGNFAGQQTNASITPGLAPDTRGGIFGVPDLGGRGIPGVLIVVATAGLAALGASHLGIWHNRRSALGPA